MHFYYSIYIYIRWNLSTRSIITTLFMISSVTYYLDLHCAITSLLYIYFLTNKGQIWIL